MIVNPFTYKKVRLNNGIRLKVSRHFNYGFFGVRGRYDNVARTGAYVNTFEPGVGFFVHSLDSHSYRHFVKAEQKKLKQNFWTLILGKEPRFGKESKRVEKALESGNLTPVQNQILAQYLVMLNLGEKEEYFQRVIAALKKKMHSRRNNGQASYLSGIISSYKTHVATLQHDAKGSQLNIKNMLTPEALEEWHKVVDAFYELVDVRRIWQVVDGDSYEQVFFDMGIFDYIQSPFDTPMMRDSKGGLYFLYPQGLICRRSNVDFDFIPMQELDIQGGSLDINTLTSDLDMMPGRGRKRRYSDAISTLYSTVSKGSMAVGEFRIKNLDLTFCCNHVSNVVDFVKALNDFKHVNVPKDFSLANVVE